jgi:hypothetical protein
MYSPYSPTQPFMLVKQGKKGKTMRRKERNTKSTHNTKPQHQYAILGRILSKTRMHISEHHLKGWVIVKALCT